MLFPRRDRLHYHDKERQAPTESESRQTSKPPVFLISQQRSRIGPCVSTTRYTSPSVSAEIMVFESTISTAFGRMRLASDARSEREINNDGGIACCLLLPCFYRWTKGHHGRYDHASWKGEMIEWIAGFMERRSSAQARYPTRAVGSWHSREGGKHLHQNPQRRCHDDRAKHTFKRISTCDISDI